VYNSEYFHSFKAQNIGFQQTFPQPVENTVNICGKAPENSEKLLVMFRGSMGILLENS